MFASYKTTVVQSPHSMDDEDDKKDDTELSDGALDDVLEETDDEDDIEDPLAAIDEFGGGDVEKQWE